MIAAHASRADNYPGGCGEMFGAQFAEVEVDTLTGRVRVLKVAAAHDCGRTINRLAAESAKSLQTADTREKLANIGIEMIAKGPEDFATYLKGESARFAAIIKDGNIKLDP